MTGMLFVYVTVGSDAGAHRIASAVIEERLAACANILPPVTSVYRWQGKVEQGTEHVLVLKTRAALFERLERRIKDMHSYECPCIVALPIEAGHPPFLRWLAEETETEGRP